MKSLNQFLEAKHSFMINGQVNTVLNNKYKDKFFVDLGLSVKWAKCNLGAKKETDYGHYYMWGSTKPNDNDNCYWENVPFNNSSSDFDQDYFDSVKNKVCPNGILAPEYDAAYKESNGKYRMPTQEEFDELIKNTKHERIKNYNGTKVNGIKFINKSDNTKFIFIPAAGNRFDSLIGGVDTLALVWSASIRSDSEYRSWRLMYDGDYIFTDSRSRCFGFSVRPVQDK